MVDDDYQRLCRSLDVARTMQKMLPGVRCVLQVAVKTPTAVFFAFDCVV